ncbi:MAG: serine hydrolase domain-containing protein [Pseudomonadota bacterium]
MIRLLIALLCLLPLNAVAQTPQTLSALEAEITAIVEESPLPGMALVIVEDGEVVLEKGFGLAVRNPEKPMRAETVLSPGSLSKNLTSLAVLRLVQQGKLDLDAPITDVAPGVKIDNPYGTPITLAMLLEHTAGIEGSAYSEYAFSQEGFTPGEYAKRVAGKIDMSWPPGYFFSYANGGHTLAAVAIETACGCSYDDFMATEIFAPLEMTNSTFLMSDVDLENLAQSYHSDGKTQANRWRMAIRPSGAMLSTIADLGKLVQFYATRGQSQPGLISPALLKRMEDSETTATSRAGLVDGTYGLGNFGSIAGGGHVLHGHAGSTEGFRTWLTYDPDTQRGYAFVLNADVGLRGRLINLLGRYITRDYPEIPIAAAVSDSALADLSGWYEPITHDMVLRRWMWRVFGSVKLAPTGTGLKIDPVVPTNARETLVAVGGGKLRTQTLPIPTAARVIGPGGVPMLVNGEAFQPVNTVVAVGRFYGFAAALVLGTIASLHTLIWLPSRLLKGSPNTVGVRLRAGLLLAGLSLLILLALFVKIGMLGSLDSAARLGRVSVWSLLFLMFSVIGPAGVLMAALNWKGAQAKAMQVYAALAIAALGFAWCYLALQGWVPLITWRV